MYALLLPRGMEVLKIVFCGLFSALRIVLVVLLSESINGPLSNPVVLLFLVWIIQAASK